MIRILDRVAKVWLTRNIFIKLIKHRDFKIGELEIKLPSSHLLPMYMKVHKLYDRFVPILAGSIGDATLWIVDVGANVGDTTAGISQNCPNRILAVEGDGDFYRLLEENIEKLPGGSGRIRAVKCLVGTGDFSGGLDSTGTTATRSKAILDDSTKSLDVIIKDNDIGLDRVCLIKVDTDGYDGDILLSAQETLKTSMPILFWENEIHSDVQRSTFERFYEKIDQIGYKKFWVFDNFGNLILEECALKSLIDINNYVCAQNEGHATRTIHYVDVMASADRHLETCQRAAARYKSDVIWR